MGVHLGFSRSGDVASEVATVEVVGPDKDQRVGLLIGPHKGARNSCWLGPGAIDDLLADLNRARIAQGRPSHMGDSPKEWRGDGSALPRRP